VIAHGMSYTMITSPARSSKLARAFGWLSIWGATAFLLAAFAMTFWKG
jgi:hypothetical protein